MSLWLCCFVFLFGTTNFYAKSFAVLNMVALLLFHRNVKGLAWREPICCFQTNNSIGAKAPATVCSGSGPSDPAIPCRSRPILFFPGGRCRAFRIRSGRVTFRPGWIPGRGCVVRAATDGGRMVDAASLHSSNLFRCRKATWLWQ